MDVCLRATLQPFPDVSGELDKIIDLLKIRIHLVPVEAQVLMDEDVPEAGDRRELPSKLGPQHSQFAHTQEGLMVVGGL